MKRWSHPHAVFRMPMGVRLGVALLGIVIIGSTAPFVCLDSEEELPEAIVRVPVDAAIGIEFHELHGLVAGEIREHSTRIRHVDAEAPHPAHDIASYLETPRESPERKRKRVVFEVSFMRVPSLVIRLQLHDADSSCLLRDTATPWKRSSPSTSIKRVLRQLERGSRKFQTDGARPVATQGGGSPTAGFANLVLILSDGWDSRRATMRTFSRSAGRSWTELGTAEPVMLGDGGLGWGRGLHGAERPVGLDGPTKSEGDRRSPAGVFGLVGAYGYRVVASNETRLPYQRVLDDWVCVDDPVSRFYNRILSKKTVHADWSSSERMRRSDALYESVIAVGHNLPTPKRGAGSCIFFHRLAGPQSSTAGCFAISVKALDQLLGWADADGTVLVALTRNAHRALSRRWDLPD